MSKIHWLGAGLSSHPGIQRLAKLKLPLIIWNRTLEKAEQALAGIEEHKAKTEKLDLDSFANHIQKNDIVVSMLPAKLHPKVAALCLDKHAHFISSSYISAEMQTLNEAVKHKGLCFVNETGLDPGLDHIFAHTLMAEYKASPDFDPKNRHSFRSYCGGFPKTPNDFKYKFSWSPLGVLRALKSPARWITNNQQQSTDKPWKSLTSFQVNLENGNEIFQAYPNRDSIPFISEYGFSHDFYIEEFIRGTLRLDGWAQAWQPIFDEVDVLDIEQNSNRLEALSHELWEKHAYDKNEADRVVLSVELEVSRDNQARWYKAYTIDAIGNDKGSAMARLVSYTVSFAVESILEKQIKPGVSAAPKDPAIAKQWLQQLGTLGENIYINNKK